MSDEEKQANDKMMKEALKVFSVMPSLTYYERSAYLSSLLLISYKLMRQVEGNEFVLGWLQSALQEVQSEPSDVAINEFH